MADDLDDLVDPITLPRPAEDAGGWSAATGSPGPGGNNLGWPSGDAGAPRRRPRRPDWAAGVRSRETPSDRAWSDPGIPPGHRPAAIFDSGAGAAPSHASPPTDHPRYVPAPAASSLPLDPAIVGPAGAPPGVPPGPAKNDGPAFFEDFSTARENPTERSRSAPAPGAGRWPGSPGPNPVVLGSSAPPPAARSAGFLGPNDPSPRPPLDQPGAGSRDPAEADGEREDDGTYRGAVIAALVWCAIPLVFYIGWALLMAGKAEAGCYDDNGQPCVSPRVVAWTDLSYAAPMLVGAAGLSVVIALVLRRVTTGWRSTTVGFASAVVGSGLVTVLWSAVVR